MTWKQLLEEQMEAAGTQLCLCLCVSLSHSFFSFGLSCLINIIVMKTEQLYQWVNVINCQLFLKFTYSAFISNIPFQICSGANLENWNWNHSYWLSASENFACLNPIFNMTVFLKLFCTKISWELCLYVAQTSPDRIRLFFYSWVRLVSCSQSSWLQGSENFLTFSNDPFEQALAVIGSLKSDILV